MCIFIVFYWSYAVRIALLMFADNYGYAHFVMKWFIKIIRTQI
ncbi:hypothetical protein FEDK69T_07760 [Flavobacterium enshiense DK69]|nr:hypothetical protein FEDK69T_07760 [Flavobacterium enshiense DK69]